MVGGSIFSFIAMLIAVAIVFPLYFLFSYIYLIRNKASRAKDEKFLLGLSSAAFALLALVCILYAALRPYAADSTSYGGTFSSKNQKEVGYSTSESAGRDNVPFAGFSFWYSYCFVLFCVFLTLISLVFHALEVRARNIVVEKLHWRFRGTDSLPTQR
jgi:hypothetical protein